MSEQELKRPESVLVIIYCKTGEVLLLERADYVDGWQSVTGSLEGDEMPWQTVIREVKEETGILLQVHQIEDWQRSHRFEIYPRWRFRYAAGVTHNLEHVWGVCLSNPCEIRLSSLEHVRYQWVNWQEAVNLVFSPSNREMLQLLGQHLIKEPNNSAS